MTAQDNSGAIPADIEQAARKAASKWFSAIGQREYHFSDAIAFAIMDERERCAKVIDTYRPDASFDDSSAGYVERDALLKDLAARVRGSA